MTLSDVVNACAMHRSGSVLATTSGQRYFSSSDQSDDDSLLRDHTLKLWSTVAAHESRNSAIDE